MLSRSTLRYFLVFLLAGSQVVPSALFAQQPGAATVRGSVSDPDNAVIPGATVTLTPTSGRPLIEHSASDGTYAVRNVPAGTYSLTITMAGFASFVRQSVRVAAGQTVTLDAKLAIQTENQEVQVSASDTQLSVDSDSNASSTVIKGADLDALSDDPDELASELSALAGPAAGPDGGQIYIDGFTGGQLPPKSSIREIRVNQNPFSAQYDRLGFGRVEILTKPGTDKFHGSASLQGNSSAFNTGNPFVNSQPPYHTIFFLGNLTGPINSKASFTLSGSRRQIQNNNIINGTIFASSATSPVLCQPGDTSCAFEAPFATALTAPQTRWDINPRIDLAISEKNTLITRLQYESNDITSTGSGFNLASQGYVTDSSEPTVQISDTQVISSRVINETRFEYQIDKARVTPFNTAPQVSVSGSFTGGGSSSGASSDRTTHIEVQNYTSVQLKKNFIRMGGRLRYNRDANSTTAGTNGSFSYDCLLTKDCAPITTAHPVQYSYENDQPSQFSITTVTFPVVASVTDVGVYAEDDWKPKQNLTFSYGFRYETQNWIGEHHDIAPRVSFAYGVPNGKSAPKTVVRGGFGVFFTRFPIASLISQQEQNGVNQIRITLKDPPAPCSPSNIVACETASSGNTKTTINSNLRTPYTLQFAIGADQQLFRGATLSVNYLRAQGEHQFYSQNLQALTSASAITSVDNEYESGGIFRQNQLTVNFNIRRNRVTMFGYYSLNFAHADTSGFNSYPTLPFHIQNDYGRASFDVRNRIFLGGNISLPHLISLNPLVVAQSGNPYNVVTGTDLNNDNTYNDRPAFLNGNSANCAVAADFNSTPGTSYTEIPINYCTGPALFTTNLRIAKTFGFGPNAGDRARNGGGGRQGGFGAPGGGPGGPRGGGGGGRGGGGASSGKRYNLTFSAQIQNLFNTTNLGNPGGNLNSLRLFGHSTQLAGGQGGLYSSAAAKQRTTLQMNFTF